jgi:hypothetical protein
VIFFLTNNKSAPHFLFFNSPNHARQRLHQGHVAHAHDVDGREARVDAGDLRLKKKGVSAIKQGVCFLIPDSSIHTHSQTHPARHHVARLERDRGRARAAHRHDRPAVAVGGVGGGLHVHAAQQGGHDGAGGVDVGAGAGGVGGLCVEGGKGWRPRN